MTNLEILGWVLFAVCMAILAILATKVIIRILKVCGNRTDHYTVNTKTENYEDLDYEEKYQAVTSAQLALTEAKDRDFDSSNIISITQNQEKINKEIKFLEQGKESKNCEKYNTLLMDCIIGGGALYIMQAFITSVK